MTEPVRIRLPNHRPAIRAKVSLEIGGVWFEFYADIGYMPRDAAEHAGRPLETFLRPRGAVKAGSILAHYADDGGEDLSLLLQYGHTPASLYRRYKPGSLNRGAIGALLVIAFQEGLALDDESRELAGALAGRILDGTSREMRA